MIAMVSGYCFMLINFYFLIVVKNSRYFGLWAGVHVVVLVLWRGKIVTLDM